MFPTSDTPSRRSVARGAAWSIPAITVATAAPAIAASPCSDIKANSPLPARLFNAYFIVTNQSFGGAANKVDTFASGIWLDKTNSSAACIPGASTSSGPTITSYALNTTTSGSMTLTNNTTYQVYGGSGQAGMGTLGKRNSDCSGPAGAVADACNTYTGNSLRNSTGTSSANPRSAILNYTVTVAGYGTTLLTITVPSFTPDGLNWDGVGVTVS